jgi:hypothetical protein
MPAQRKTNATSSGSSSHADESEDFEMQNASSNESGSEQKPQDDPMPIVPPPPEPPGKGVSATSPKYVQYFEDVTFRQMKVGELRDWENRRLKQRLDDQEDVVRYLITENNTMREWVSY